MSHLPSIWANNLTELAHLCLHGQIGVFTQGDVKSRCYEGSFVVAHDDLTFYCWVRHKDSRQPPIHRLKINTTTKVQNKPNGIIVKAEDGTVIRITACNTDRRPDANFSKVLLSVGQFLERITKNGLTVKEFRGKSVRKSGPLDCASRYSDKMFDFSIDEDDENAVVTTPDHRTQSSENMSFLNPNANWFTQERNSGRPHNSLQGIDKDLMTSVREPKPQSKRQPQPKLPSYGKRQVLAAQHNIEKKPSLNSFYGVNGDNSTDDITNPAITYRRRSINHPNIFGNRLLSSTSDSPRSQSKDNKSTNKSLSQAPSSRSSDMSASRQSTLSFQQSSQSGFSNLGNTCYMNSILQALLGLKSFAEDLKSRDNLERVSKGSFYRSLHGLLVAKENKVQFDVRRAALCDVKKCLERAVEGYRGGRQQDAHEFLCLVFDLLDSELEQAGKMEMEDISPSNLSLAELHSPVALNFACNTRRTLVCKGCGRKNVTNEMFLTFPIALSDSRVAVGVPSVQSMFLGFFDDYEVRHTCGCGHGKGTVSRSVTSLPRVLVVILSRGHIVNQTYVKRTDRVQIPRILLLDDVCDVQVKAPKDFVCKQHTRERLVDTPKCTSPAPLHDKRKQTEISMFHCLPKLSPAAEKTLTQSDFYIQNMSEEEQLRMALERSRCTASLLEKRTETDKENWICPIPCQFDGSDRLSPSSESIYESGGNSSLLFTQRKSLSGDKRKREKRIEPIIELSEGDGTSCARKRLCLGYGKK